MTSVLFSPCVLMAKYDVGTMTTCTVLNTLAGALWTDLSL